MNTDKTGAFSFFNENGCGWENLRFYVETPQGRIVPDSWKANQAQILPGIKITLHFQKSAEGGLKVTPEIQNRSRKDFRFGACGFLPEKVLLEKVPEAECVYLHSANLRHEQAPFYAWNYPLIASLPIIPRFFGDTPDNAAPVLFLGRAGRTKWLMEGALTQTRRRTAWEIALPPDHTHGDVILRSAFTFNGADFLHLPAGKTETLETMLYQFAEGEPDQLHKHYLAELKQLYPPVKAIPTFAYCSWNYGRFYNVTMKREEANMKILSKLIPGAYYQLDSGYQVAENGKKAIIDCDYEQPNPDRPCEACDLWYTLGDKVWDRSRFPEGPQGFVAACRKYGLKPALWWSPRLGIDGVLSKEHPDWILRDKTGTPLSVGHWMLDYSIPEVQAFLEKIVRKIHSWKMEGIKVDFSSWMFDHPKACFRFPATGTELRWKFLNMIRRIMGEKAYIMQGVSIPMGNPFMGIAGLNVHRSGADIHSGTWEQNRRACSWTVQTMLASQNQYFMLNLDSFMGDPAIPVAERRMRVILAYMTGGVPEFGGMLADFTPEMKKEVKLLFERNDPEMTFECPDATAFYGFPLPSVVVRRNRPNSATMKRLGIQASFAMFNWSDQEETASIPLEFIKSVKRDFFTGKPFRKTMVILPPHSGICIDVMKK